VRAADATPGRGDFWILKIAHAPSPKNLSKNGLPRRGVAFLWKTFLQKNFQVREKIPPSALAFGCSHALVAAGLRSRRPHSSLLVACSGSKASSSARTRTAAPGEAADWLKSRTRTCAAVKREAEEDLGR
jgi:hypothetical protein